MKPLNYTKNQHTLVWLLLLSLISPISYAAVAIGKISFARGSIAASQPGKTLQLIGKDSEIYLGDNIQTSSRSFAIIVFNDGAKVTVRPNSNFSINQYNNKRGQENALLTLHKGGVRASSGEIARKNPNKYKIKTPYATIKAQQADYSVRICHNDCAQEAKKLKPKKIKRPQSVIARVIKLKGSVTAAHQKKLARPTKKAQAIKQAPRRNKKRQLTIGAPLYTADHLNSKNNSHALIAFRDGSRITLQANSEFDINRYSYQSKEKTGFAFFNLIKGGLRALTGRIGKIKQANYQINTPVATIGIRGTGLDLNCVGDCVDENPKTNGQDKISKEIQTAQAEGLYSTAWQDTISLSNSSGDYELTSPESNYIANRKSKPQALKQAPKSMRENPAPRPDQINININLFASTALPPGTPSGVYVSVDTGYVQISNDLTETPPQEQSAEDSKETPAKITTLDLGENEGAYINSDGDMIRLDQQQDFQDQDPYPQPTELQLDPGIYSLLKEDYESNNDPVYQCVVN